MTRGMLLVGAICLFPLIAGADTLYLKNGASRDGKVTQPNDNAVVLEVGGMKTTYLASEVERIERNDKMGDAGAPDPATLQHEMELQKVTGLTAQQRHDVEALLEPLKSEDAAVRKRAAQRLIEKGKEVDIVPFLEYSLEGLSELYTGPVLEVMLALNPAKTWPLVRRAAHDRNQAIRATAIHLLAAQGKKDLALIVRGLVDPEPVVVIAAAEVVRQLADPRATPVLMTRLDSPNPRVRNACLSALSAIWSADPSARDLTTSEQWRAYWDTHASSVKSPFMPGALEPLIVVAEDGHSTYYNE